MSDENDTTEEDQAEPGLVERALDAVGLGADPDPAADVPVAEEPPPTAEEGEEARKKAIRKGMAGNLGDKEVGKRGRNAGRRNVREQPDFEEHEEPEAEE